MSDVSLTGFQPVAPRAIPVESVSGGGKPPLGGKVLPPAAQETVSEQPKVREIYNPAEKIQAAVAHMNEYIQASQRDLMFSFDEESGHTVVKVLDRRTQEVIRQIPDDIFLQLARTLSPDDPIPLVRAQV